MICKAIVAVQKREYGTELTAQRYSVPRSTLQSYLKKENVKTNSLGHCPVLGVVTELELVRYIKLMKSKLFGLMRRNVIEIAFTLAYGDKIKYSFGSGYARCGWLDHLDLLCITTQNSVYDNLLALRSQEQWIQCMKTSAEDGTYGLH